jgi:hypothetical protein
MLTVSLWLFRLGRELVSDVLRVFPSLSHKSKKNKTKNDGQRPGDHTTHTGKAGYSLGMAAPGDELLLFVREADRSIREGLADCKEEEKTNRC